MRKAALCIVVCALVISGDLASAFPVSFGKPPRLPSEEDKGQVEPRQDMPGVDEDDQADVEEGIDLSQPLTLEQCIKIALERATELRTAQLDLILEEMSVKDAQSRYWPQIDTDGGYQFSDAVDFGWERENYDASVGARYVIWDHGQREGTLVQARYRRDAEYSRYDRTEQSLIFNIIRTYYDLLETENLIDVDEQILEQSRQNVEKITAFVEVGEAIPSDIATAKVQQATDELNVINNQINMDLTRADLAILMGLAPDTPLSIVDAPDYEIYMQTGVIETEEISVEDAISQALVRRPEMAEMNASKAILESALMLAQLERWPKITAECDYNLRLSDYLSERDAMKNHRSWNVSARASYPVFDAGRSRRVVQRADIAMQRLNESASELERSITLEVYQAYLDLERARKSLDIARVQVEDAKMGLDVTQGRYDQHMIILLELLDSQARYARSLINQVKAFYDYKVARGTLERAMGVLQ